MLLPNAPISVPALIALSGLSRRSRAMCHRVVEHRHLDRLVYDTIRWLLELKRADLLKIWSKIIQSGCLMGLQFSIIDFRLLYVTFHPIFGNAGLPKATGDTADFWSNSTAYPSEPWAEGAKTLACRKLVVNFDTFHRPAFSLSHMVSFLPNLVDLSICQRSVGEGDVMSVLVNCPHLRSLTLNVSTMRSGRLERLEMRADQFKLTKLILHGSCSCEFLTHLIGSNPLITNLCIDVREMTRPQIAELYQVMDPLELESLVLRGRAHWKNITWLATPRPSLRSLSLELTGVVYHLDVGHHSNLERIGTTRNLNAQDLVELITDFPSLKEIVLEWDGLDCTQYEADSGLVDRLRELWPSFFHEYAPNPRAVYRFTKHTSTVVESPRYPPYPSEIDSWNDYM